MVKLSGISVCGGSASGTLMQYHRKYPPLSTLSATNPEAELQRFSDALARAVRERELLRKKVLSSLGESESMIFYIHQMMLNDPDFIASTHVRIQEFRETAETAVSHVIQSFTARFFALEDRYLRERSADLRDIGYHLISVLTHTDLTPQLPNAPVILAAEDLFPSEAVLFREKKIAAFVTAQGTRTSHTAILAKSMQIPMLIEVSDILLPAYQYAAAEVSENTVILHPSPKNSVTQKNP